MISHLHKASWELQPDPPDYNAALPPTTNYDIPTFICCFPLPPALPFIIILLLLEIAFNFFRPTYGAEADAELPPARDYDNCLSTLRTLRSTFAYLLIMMTPLPAALFIRSLRSTFETLEVLLMTPTQMLIFAGLPSFKICPPRRSAQNAWWTTTFAWCDSAISALPLLTPTSTTALLWPSLAGNYNYSTILRCLLPVDTSHGEDKSRWLKHGGLHCYYLDKRHGGIPHGGCSHCGLDSWRVWGVLLR